MPLHGYGLLFRILVSARCLQKLVCALIGDGAIAAVSRAQPEADHSMPFRATFEFVFCFVQEVE